MNLHRYNHRISSDEIKNYLTNGHAFTIKLPAHIDSVMAVTFRIPIWRKIWHFYTHYVMKFYYLLKYLITKRKIVWTGSYIPLEAMVQYNYDVKKRELRVLSFMYDGKYSIGRHYVSMKRRIEITYISESKDRDDKLKQLGI